MSLINISKLDLKVDERKNNDLIKRLDRSIICYLNFNDYVKTLKELLKSLNFICSSDSDFICIKKYLDHVDFFINKTIECKDSLYKNMKSNLNIDQLLILFDLDNKGVKL